MEEKNTKQGPASVGIKYNVMPEEFRKVSVKKLSKKQMIVFGGIFAGLILAGGGVFAVLTFMKPNQVVINPPVEEPVKPAEEPVQPVPTTTPPVSLTEKPTSTEEKKPEGPSVPIVAKVDLPPGQDTDADGMTDKEEALFQSDATRPDTDADGYLDGNELFYLYNPSGLAPAGILESGLVRLWKNISKGYEIYYPHNWSSSSSKDGAAVGFVTPDNIEQFTVSVFEADKDLSLRSWYISKYPESDINALQSYTSRKGLQGLQEKDRLTTYFKKDGKVVIVKYDPGDADAIWYRRTYDMILNSLVIE